MPAKIPDWAWAALERWVARHKSKSPPPPTPPPPPPTPPTPRSIWTDPPWKGKVVYFAWGLESGQFTPDSLADFAARCGARAAAVQITPGNLGFLNAAKVALHARGIAYLVWERSDQISVDVAISDCRTLQPDGYLADVEGPGQYPAFPTVFAKALPNLPRALCATGALDNWIPGGAVAASAPWIAANWDLTMQDYVADNPNATPADEDNFAFWRGWPDNAIGKKHYPVIEVEAEGSKPLADQLASVSGWRDENGRLCFGVYLAEEMSDADVTNMKAA